MADSRIETLLENWAGADNEILPPISNVERILQNILGVEGVDIEPIQSRNEALLLQILEQGGGSGGGSGDLETETGTFTLDANNARPTVSFKKTHDLPPSIIVMIKKSDVANVNNENVAFMFIDIYRLLGVGYPYINSTIAYAMAMCPAVYSGSIVNYSNFILHNSDDTSAETYQYSRFWADTTAFYPSSYTSSANSRTWKKDIEYQWMAIWL